MEKFIIAEKEIMCNIQSPFIVKMYETYKDSHFIYMLLGYF